MFDCHYDLLTHIYAKRNNIDYIKRYYNNMYNKNNIIGGIFNLFYMGYNEMKEELNINKEEINIIENLRTVKNIIEKYNIIPINIKYVFGIEGLDYLESIEDLDILYELGVRSVNPVWNNKNKFGGGVRADENYGLTKEGEKLIEKLVKKNIAIDLSHSNSKTFFNIIDKCKEMNKKGYKVKVFASHSNSKEICNVNRNLTDRQILEIKKINGIIGIVSIKKFCKKTKIPFYNYKRNYLKHIIHIRDLLGGVDNIALSTDDMSYYEVIPNYYKNLNIFKRGKVSGDIKKLLKNSNKFHTFDINKIMYENAMRFFQINIK